ncbi:class IV adenylate cyclase [Holophaga foetida]|uniref:class IV adenylate cyclase n=1 Tax=Holophaga foetida TaxID=35839 RepID=UPI000247215B|nr:class IV adenylate cyclase [Holophaga foetida]
MPHPLETEVKLPVSDLGALRPLLLARGFRTSVEAQNEKSVLWDRQRELLEKGCALRVRQYGSATRLTWKGPKVPDARLKIRPELETGIEDGGVLEGILLELGFAPVLSMEKRREVLTRPGLTACLDEAPFGSYLELEGSAEAIQEALVQLGLEDAPVETRSYPALYEAHGLV